MLERLASGLFSPFDGRIATNGLLTTTQPVFDAVLWLQALWNCIQVVCFECSSNAHGDADPLSRAFRCYLAILALWVAVDSANEPPTTENILDCAVLTNTLPTTPYCWGPNSGRYLPHLRA